MRGASGIWRALERARTMNLAEAGMEPPVAGDGGITRRRALAAIAGAAGLAACRDLPALSDSSSSVAIVGGGLAGLTALDRLRRANVGATLYEARGAEIGRAQV